MMMFRLNPNIDNKFICYFLNSPIILEHVNNLIGGSAAPHINVGDIKEYPVPFPSLEEQKEIVRRVEQLFAFADRIEARYTKAKAMLDKLPQSILAKAFRGELVPQNPNDEPASVLLEKIKAEKEKLAEKRNLRKKI
jgi:type I restriction enzyme S subunit